MAEVNGNILKKAQKLLPDPDNFEKNYIDIEIPAKDGMHWVVTFAKQEIDGIKYWMALPNAR